MYQSISIDYAALKGLLAWNDAAWRGKWKGAGEIENKQRILRESDHVVLEIMIKGKEIYLTDWVF